MQGSKRKAVVLFQGNSSSSDAPPQHKKRRKGEDGVDPNRATKKKIIISRKHLHSRAAAPLKTSSASSEMRPPSRVIDRAVPNSSHRWNFEVDYNDHFETPLIAFQDIFPVLQEVFHQNNGSEQKLRKGVTIYDPYYCEGRMKQHLQQLGFNNVINDNRDFYRDVQQEMVPEHDILITNPPYSGEHKMKLLTFLASRISSDGYSDKDISAPFALLLPAYVASKSYWREFSAKLEASSLNCFYILPPDYYAYNHPENTGKELPPFYSAWFVGGFSAAARSRIFEKVRQAPRAACIGGAEQIRRLPINRLAVFESVEQLLNRGIITGKRPNPKQRRRMLKKNS